MGDSSRETPVSAPGARNPAGKSAVAEEFIDDTHTGKQPYAGAPAQKDVRDRGALSWTKLAVAFLLGRFNRRPTKNR
jgi:hypothetical protein